MSPLASSSVRVTVRHSPSFPSLCVLLAPRLPPSARVCMVCCAHVRVALAHGNKSADRFGGDDSSREQQLNAIAATAQLACTLQTQCDSVLPHLLHCSIALSAHCSLLRPLSSAPDLVLLPCIPSPRCCRMWHAKPSRDQPTVPHALCTLTLLQPMRARPLQTRRQLPRQPANLRHQPTARRCAYLCTSQHFWHDGCAQGSGGRLALTCR